MLKKIFASTAIIVSILFVAGCVSTTSSGHSSSSNDNTRPYGLGISAEMQFIDLPVPMGFKNVREDSFIFQNDATRVGIIRYHGRAYASDVIEFYKTQMPLFNWGLINVVEYGRVVMNFEKETETCIITIEPQTTKTVITVAIAPKSKPAINTATETKEQSIDN